MSRHLLDHNLTVHAVDCLMFGDRGIRDLMTHPRFIFQKGDIRDEASYRGLLGEVDAVVHLAAVSGMPSCDKYPEMATEINLAATKRLFDHCSRTQSIQRFVFASTTSVYGAVKDASVVNEESQVGPISLYAELKAKCETYILQSEGRPDFTPTVLRFPTVYGLSPRMRFDLTVNEFARDLTLGKKLEIFGEHFWRPYCHVSDLARACLRVLESPPSLVCKELYGVGDSSENYTKRMIYEILVEMIPDAKVSLIKNIADARDYRVDFTKIKRLGFCISKTVRDGVREVYEAVRKGLIADPYDPLYTSAL
jgi:nucleoside-diphosphate-sugar epimerase